MEGLEAEEPRARVQALQRAATLDRAEAGLEASLVARLLDEVPAVRRAALEAIGALAYRKVLAFGPRATAAVTGAARDEAWFVRSEAAVALAVLVDRTQDRRPIVRTLLTLLEDDSPEVRREAAAGLGDTGSQEPKEALHRHLSDSDDQTRFEAAFALATLKDARGLDLLVAALDTGRRRLDACEALRRLGSMEAVAPLREQVKKFFIGWPERLTLWATLHSLGDSGAAGELIARAASKNRQERALALGLIGTHKVGEGADLLRRVASDAKDPLQGTAIRALGDLGDSADRELLSRLSRDQAAPPEVRADSAAALARLGS